MRIGWVVVMVTVAALFAPAARAQADAADVSGAWRGVITDLQGNQGDIEFALWPQAPGRHIGVVRYPRCWGQLTQLTPEEAKRAPPLIRAGAEGPIWLNEHSPSRPECETGGFLAVTVVARNPMIGATLRWQRLDGSGKLAAEARLVPAPPSAELVAGAQRSAPQRLQAHRRGRAWRRRPSRGRFRTARRRARCS